MEFARRVAGEGAAKKAVEKCRRQYLKYVTDKPASKTKYMTASTAARYAAVLGAPEDAFLEPYEDPREREARRLEARAQKLRLALRDGP